ncbi:uncharacterized protein BDZ99DRAFT_500650 [Mytilinidion resinicola]|uniref:G domain-containing protein n=1 Tax=Mytilinidion resinicola TaxID=574789 RepID=A0A6A6YHI3_9PEZI|nr:uncharacterized protein BDZ99DRAFT_500650 [Mytilinidion resinicola]KAF2807464.1 hypothetical protein BDZ99DRAFT_500650 [Mytilinidion resinicola]
MSRSTGGSSLKGKAIAYPTQPDLPELRPNDIVIAVMGITGTGKTTLISYFSEREMKIGHGLEACTATVEISRCNLPDGSKIFLVDTPGFDDTYKSDTEILREVAHWLTAAYTHDIKLTGIIYLHRIQDPRVTGTGLKNLIMFQKLCGEEGLGSVVLATTRWSAISLETAEDHESQLKAEFWKAMIDHGSRVFRQDRGRESALEIIQYLIRKKRPVTLDIQSDMVDKGLELNETAAGKEVVSEAEKQNKANEERIALIRKELQEALTRKDEESREELEELKAETEKEMRTYREELQKMKVGREELRRQMEEKYKKEKEQLLQQMQANEKLLEEEEHRRRTMEEKHKQDLELQKAKLQNKYYQLLLSDKCWVM